MRESKVLASVCLWVHNVPCATLPCSAFTDGSGPVVAGKLFPFCFITIACGVISGFHSLIASGTTPKLITREGHARSIGYGAMCLESLVAIMALIAACTLDPAVYLSMNIKGEPAAVVAKINALNMPAFHATTEKMDALAAEVGEKSLFGRTGGAATLAVGMAQIFSNVTSGRWLDLWYHFAIMFEALFILTTIDAGTRVGRYILQDFLSHLWKPLGDTRNFRANLIASILLVGGWGWFLIQGVRDPLGGINSLWPLFGIANQMLAAIALCLGTTIILKMQLGAPSTVSALSKKHQHAGSETGVPKRRPVFALITLIPLVWLLAVTYTAGLEKIFHPDPRIGFNAAARAAETKREQLRSGLANIAAEQVAAQGKEISQLAKQVFNYRLDALVAGTFLLLVSVIVIISVREWILLWSGRKPAVLHETEPVYLPDYAVAEGGKPMSALGTAAIAFTLVKELSGESQLERARQQAVVCECAAPAPSPAKTDDQIYLETTEQRFNGVRRCC